MHTPKQAFLSMDDVFWAVSAPGGEVTFSVELHSVCGCEYTRRQHDGTRRHDWGRRERRIGTLAVWDLYLDDEEGKQICRGRIKLHAKPSKMASLQCIRIRL